MRRAHWSPVLPLATVTLAVVFAAACGRSAPEPESEPLVGVTVQAARIATLRHVATASGIVVPSAAGDVVVYAQEAAEVVELPKKEGEPVATGDLLVRFEVASIAQELAARELAVAEATVRLERAKSELSRLSALFDRGIAPRVTFEAARSEQTAAESSRGQLVAELQIAKVESERASVRARFPGMVVKVWRTVGEFVSANVDPVLQVVDPSRFQVAVELPVAQLAEILPGQSATVRAIAGDADLPATVAMKPVTTDPNAPTGQVRLAFADPPALARDTPVSVEILLDQRADALVVPVAALAQDATSAYVMVAGDDRRAHRRDVRAGLATRELVEVVAGLHAGERVIVGGLTDVAEGTAIAFVE